MDYLLDRLILRNYDPCDGSLSWRCVLHRMWSGWPSSSFSHITDRFVAVPFSALLTQYDLEHLDFKPSRGGVHSSNRYAMCSTCRLEIVH